MDNKIINIGGTSRSGSTLLAKILSTNSNSLNLGEISSIFYPTRIHHLEEIKKIKNPWKNVLNQGVKKLPKSIFNNFSDVDFLVDSSKNGFWIKTINKNAQKQNIITKNILIFKEPVDFAHSIIKRGGTNWEEKYIQYHKKYFALIRDFYVISYSSLVNNKETLKKLCDWLKINYSDEKYNYWNDLNNTGFFGSKTPYKHLKVQQQIKTNHKITKQVDDAIIKNKELNRIFNYLKTNQNQEVKIPKLKTHGSLKMAFFEIKNKIKLLYRKHNPEDYFKKKS